MMRLVARSWEMKNHSDAWRAGHFDTRSQGITQDTNRGCMIAVMGTCGSFSHSVTITVNVTA